MAPIGPRTCRHVDGLSGPGLLPGISKNGETYCEWSLLNLGVPQLPGVSGNGRDGSVIRRIPSRMQNDVRDLDPADGLTDFPNPARSRPNS
eukprot:3925213-Pyramimonas_sp.AAC.1